MVDFGPNSSAPEPNDDDFSIRGHRISRRSGLERIGQVAWLLSLNQFERIARECGYKGDDIKSEWKRQQDLIRNGPMWMRPCDFYGIRHGYRHVRRFFEGTVWPRSVNCQDGVIVTTGKTLLDESARSRILDEVRMRLDLEKPAWSEFVPFYDMIIGQFFEGYSNCPAYINVCSSRKRFRKRLSASSQKLDPPQLYTIDAAPFASDVGVKVPVKELVEKGIVAWHRDSRVSDLWLGMTWSTRKFRTSFDIPEDFQAEDATELSFDDKADEAHWTLVERHEKDVENLQSGEWPGCIDNYHTVDVENDTYVTPLLGIARVMYRPWEREKYWVARLSLEFEGSSARLVPWHYAEYPIGPAMRVSWREHDHLVKAVDSVRSK